MKKTSIVIICIIGLGFTVPAFSSTAGVQITKREPLDPSDIDPPPKPKPIPRNWCERYPRECYKRYHRYEERRRAAWCLRNPHKCSRGG